ncbi:CLAVATA3/ESR-RELATED 17 [Perilla frutescens var. frutescens]|nr:CLAVATA3/ESR-RELATED 17 [Perilla frutescens var. frutescens]
MGNGREVGCFCLLLLLIVLVLENPCFADGSSRFNQGKKGSPSNLNPARIIDQNRYKGINIPDKDVVRDDVFGAEKRRVYTGPNPLHNR